MKHHLLQIAVTKLRFATAALCFLALSTCTSQNDNSKTKKRSTSPTTCFSVIGSSGQPIVKKILSLLDRKRYTGSITNSKGERVKLSGHRYYSSEFRQLVEENNVRAVLIFRDPRDNFKQLVYRSLYDWCPNKWEKERIHPNALKYHLLVKQNQDNREGKGMAELYIESTGGKHILDSIFAVTDWIKHPNILPIRIESLLNFKGNNEELQYSTIQQIADFIGTTITSDDKEKLISECKAFLSKRATQDGYMKSWSELFTENDKRIFKKYYGQLLIDLGYEQDYNW